MVTREFQERVKAVAQNGILGEAGLASLKNAVVGLASMLEAGRISEDAVVVLADGNFYDASNRADLLRLAADSAKKARDLFIGEERFTALIQQCNDMLDHAQNLPPQTINNIRTQIEQLRELAETAMNLRRAASAGIKTDYQFTDDTGNVKSDSKFQKKQLDQIRDSLRAFRYDLDTLRGVNMRLGEKIRRFFDEKRSSYSGTRIDGTMYTQMQTADNNFNNKLREIQLNILGHAVQDVQVDANNSYAGATGEVALGDKINLADSAKAATHLSHLTNDRIRYHYSGVEKRPKEIEKAIKEQVGDIAESGGERTVTLRVGADFLFDLNLGFVEAEAKAGASVNISAQIKVNNNNGTVAVTYSKGVKVHAGAFGTLGVNREATGENLKEGLGAVVSGDVSLDARHSVTKTYANFDEFIRATSKYDLVVTPRPREVFYAWCPRAIKGIGHLFMLGATALGLRIHRSRMDQVAYSSELRNRNVFGPLSGLLLKKRNVEVLGKRKALAVTGGAKVTAEAGIFYENNGGMDSNVEFGGSLGVTHTREYFVKNKTYVSFAKSLMKCSVDFLKDRFTSELNEQNAIIPGGDAWRADIMRIVQDTDKGDQPHYDARRIASAFTELTTKLHELEESVAKNTKKDDSFWNKFAAQSRILAVTVALLTKRANALEGTDSQTVATKKAAKAAGEYIIPRLANPIVQLPEKIYQEKFFKVFDVGTLPMTKTVGTVSVMYDLWDGKISEKLEDFGMREDTADTILGTAGKTDATAIADLGKETLFQAHKIEVKITRQKPRLQKEDVRPWMNSKKTTIDVRLTAAMPLRVLLDLVVRHYAKSVGGVSDEEIEESKLKQEIKDALVDSLKTTGEDTLIQGSVPLLDCSIGRLLKDSKAFKTFLSNLGAVKNAYNKCYTFEDDTFKTLRFNFSDGRFASFSLTEDYDTDAKVTIKPLAFMGIELGLSSQTSVNDYTILRKPTVNALMGVAADYATAGNQEEFTNFLTRNKNGVIRMIKTGKQNAGDQARPDDKFWATDCASMVSTINACNTWLNNLASQHNEIGEEARQHQAEFNAVVTEMREQADDISDEDALALAQRFLNAAAKVYTLAAMAPPPPANPPANAPENAA